MLTENNSKTSTTRKSAMPGRRGTSRGRWSGTYCNATGGGPGLNSLPEEDGDEEVDPRLISGTGLVIDELSVVNVPAGGMFSSSHDGAKDNPV